MIIHRGIDNYNLDACVVTVGMFDGLHKGHLCLLEGLRHKAIELGLPSVVVTLWPHPRFVINGSSAGIKLLSTIDEKIELISKTGVDHLVILEFSLRLSMLSPQSFVREVLINNLHAKYFYMGFDHHFGSGKMTLEEQESICRGEGLECSRCHQFVSPTAGKCSSSEIRQNILHGDINLASELLGREYSITGTVVHGDGIGAKIGFPTANLKVEEDYKIIPADGVYCGYAEIDEIRYKAVIDIGMRPTVMGREHRIETNILDFSSKIYGRKVTIYFFFRIREEKRFSTLEELEEQIVKDISFARQMLC